MFEPLSDVEARVLGVLVEKETTTPDYYPVTLNYLTKACNQKNNRHPVTDYHDDEVQDALDRLRLRKLVIMTSLAGARQPKYEHSITSVLSIGDMAIAILAELMFRGPQTPGELRGRCERMCTSIGSRDEVEAELDRLAQLDPALVVRLPRGPGQKEARYAHLLCGSIEIPESGDLSGVDSPALAQGGDNSGTTLTNRVYELETAVSDLRAQLQALRDELASFRKQFE